MKISKSKQELARIISENGGWRDGGFAAQDGDGGVGGYEVKPEWNSRSKYWWREALGEWFPANKIKNHHQTVLSSEEYFHLYPAPDADGWIEWKGGECPVGEYDRIDVKFIDGDTLLNTDRYWDWSHNIECKVIAYRLHKPDAGVKVKVENQTTCHLTATDKPTIEQLAADYHSAKDCAERKQQEADDAKFDEDAKLKALELAGEAIGIIVSPITAKQEPEPVAAKFTGKFHSAKHGDRPSDLDMICDGCGKRFGHHVGFECRP